MFYDAHNHLQDSRLNPWRTQVMADLAAFDLGGAVVNGLTEDDWQAVADLAQAHSWVRPSFGLHPWHVKERSAGWKDRLLDLLHLFPNAAVGEIGLDRWIENPDIPAQLECFRTQLALAGEMDRPATIHCLRAWGLLEEELRTQPVPCRGFLLHSYGGPAEMIPAFVKKGAYFSLSPYFGYSRKVAQLAAFKAIPLNRILAETDAPDMWPPDELNTHPLGETGQPLNHPANLRLSYELLAKVREMPLDELTGHIAENYHRLFGHA